MVYLVSLVLMVALTASLVRLVRVDRITAPLRVRIREWSGPHGFFTELIECSRCTSVWVSPIVTFPALALAVSYLDLPWLVAVLIAIPIAKAISYLAFLLVTMEAGD